MNFLSAIENSGFSAWVRESPSALAYPLVIFLHAAGLSMVVGLSTVIDLAILGPWHDLGDSFWWGETPGELHNQGAYVAFLDGHTSRQHWRYTPKPYTDEQGVSCANNGDREDLRWLLEHSPYWDWSRRRPAGPLLP